MELQACRLPSWPGMRRAAGQPPTDPEQPSPRPAQHRRKLKCRQAAAQMVGGGEIGRSDTSEPSRGRSGEEANGDRVGGAC